MNIFEKYLEENSKGNKYLTFLFNHWNTTKQVIESNLEYISQVFPHFTLHNSTHSEAILNNLARIIGEETIRKFSCIDIWLLLNAAYLHDYGMFITANDLENCFTSKEFLDYLQKIMSNKLHPSYKNTIYFEIHEDSIVYKKKKVSILSYYALMYLIADFYREKHADRSNRLVRNSEHLSLYNTIIPERLAEILGDICGAHTKSFFDVMTLAEKDNGLDQTIEICHPRLIAYLIRLGDLLDIDCNRIPYQAVKILGKSIPKISLDNYKKHTSIKRICICSKYISIKSYCKSYGALTVTSSWFSAIRDEINNLHNSLSDIIPTNYSINIPAIKELDFKLLNYDTFSNKEAPKFTIDLNRAMEILQGSNIYSNKYAFILELLQNATDAIFLKLSLTKAIKSFADFIDKITNSPKPLINIVINEIKNKKQSIKDKITWEICITDNGIGMKKNDLKYILDIGKHNPEKEQIINQSIEFLKPNGCFGIGFQSVFLVASNVKIITQYYKTNKINKATLLNLNSENIGTKVLLKQEKEGILKYGTRIKLNLTYNKIPNKVTLPVFFEKSTKKQTFDMYDFVNDKSLDYDISDILDNIFTFMYSSLIPIKLTFQNKTKVLQPHIINDLKNYSKNYSQATDVIIIPKFIEPVAYHTVEVFYRGSYLKDWNLKIPFFNGLIAIFFGKAQDITNLAKSNISSKNRGNILDRIYIAIAEVYMNKWFEATKEEKYAISIFFTFHKENIESAISNFKKKIKKSCYSNNIFKLKQDKLTEIQTFINDREIHISAKSYVLPAKEDNNLTINEYLTNGYQINVGIPSNPNKNNNNIEIMNDKEINMSHQIDFTYFFIQLAINDYKYNKLTINSDNSYRISKDTNTNYRYCEVDYNCYKNNFTYDFWKRSIIMCDYKYSNLAITSDIKNKLILNMPNKPKFFLLFPIMPSPYVKDVENPQSLKYKIDKNGLVDFINANKYNKETNAKDIEITLDKFIEETKFLLE